jgi:Nucleotidyltransferase domain
MLTQQRRDEVRSIVDTVMRWAEEHDDVRGVVMVGSWARDAAHIDSDLDIVVLTNTSAYADAQTWTQLLDGEVIRRQQWGPLREVRLRCLSGLDVEMGVVPLDWANTDPLDAGTYRVINDGHRILYDPDGVLAALSTACRSSGSEDEGDGSNAARI